MNFREHQNKAKSNTLKLVSIFIALTILSTVFLGFILYTSLSFLDYQNYTHLKGMNFWIFASSKINIQDLGLTSLIASSLIIPPLVLIGTAYGFVRTSNGRNVALAFNGKELTLDSDLSDKERQLLNIVNEMSVASGQPMPGVFLIPDDAINAFAAGKEPSDAVIAVTSGALGTFNREEMSAVIAHEMAHIANQDIKLSMRVAAFIFGFFMLIFAAKWLWYFSVYSSGSDNRARLGALGFAAVLALIGWILSIFGKLLKLAISRQREYLADASAVQFTRNPAGLIGALEKIKNGHNSTKIISSASDEFSHAFIFGQKGKALFSTHPPLEDRIERLRGR